MTLPIDQRAGTRLDHRFTYPVMGRAARGERQHGLIDTRQRVYQGGGRLSDFVYWREKLVSLALDVWEQITEGDVERIELIDHERNRCYSIDVTDAKQFGRVYDAGLGSRWGVPLDRWRVEQGEPPPKAGEPVTAPAEKPRNPQLSLFDGDRV